jgi:phage baseplate assembly protein V
VSWGQGEQERRLHGVVRIGTVTAVDPATARARVSLGGDAVSGWIPFTAIRAGGLNAWAPVTVGEQVVVASPGGDTAQGVIIGSLPSTSNGAPSVDGGEFRFEIGGSSISMTADGITLSSNGSTLTIDAAGITLTGAAINLN